MALTLPALNAPAPSDTEAGYTKGLIGNFLVQTSPTSKGASNFEQAVNNAARRLHSPSATLLERPILSPEEWLNDPFYSGPLSKEYWPQKKKDFVACAQGDITEVITTGAIGIGKTALAKGLVMYDLYRLSCFVEPQRALGIGLAESLVFVLVSLNITKAKAKLLDPLRAAIAMTPYFRQHFYFDTKKESMLEFPKNVVVKVGATSEGAVHSEDTVFVVISECNFLPVVADSKRKRGSESLDVAADLFTATVLRMKSRFLQGGALPLCRIVLDSSRQYPDDFVERRIHEVQTSDVGHKAIVIARSQWEAKAGVRRPDGKLYYSGETFAVEVGSESRFSRILLAEEVPYARGKVVQVPVEMRTDFERNIESALRDFAGEAVLSLRPLISNRAGIIECIRTEPDIPDYACAHPFSAPSTTFHDGVVLNELMLINPETGKPRVNPDAPRTIHVDFALTGDCLGIAMGHVSEMISVVKHADVTALDIPCTTCRGEKFVPCPRCEGKGTMVHFKQKVTCSLCRGKKMQPCAACGGTGKYGTAVTRPRIYIDMMLQVAAPPTGQIQFDDIEALIKRLRAMGYYIPVITADGYESAQFLQRQATHYGAAIAEHLSMDIKKDYYYGLRNAISDVDPYNRPRLSYYSHPVFLQEISKVEDRPNKVDHPPKGSKDVSDAVCGVVANCERIPQLQGATGISSAALYSFGR